MILARPKVLNGGYCYRRRIDAAGADRPLLDWLATTYRHSSTEIWRGRIERGEVEVNDAPATAGQRLRAGVVVAWHRPPWDEPDVPLTFEVIYEDPHMVAVAKPAGLPTMPAGGYLAHTLLARVRTRYGDAAPVHRLGRFTSGLVVFARSRAAAAALAHTWRAQDVTKRYRALVSGDPLWTSVTITTPIGPVPHARLGSVHGAHASGRAALSVATVIERRGDTALCDVDIATGRPHQIRIHLAAVGHPLSGDPLYAAGGRPRPGSPALPGEGGYLLHAHRVRLSHPIDGRRLDLEAEPPADLRCAPTP